MPIFFDPNRRYGGVARLDKVIEAEYAVVDLGPASFKQKDDVVHLVEAHPVHKLALQLFHTLVLLEDVQDMLMLHQFLLQVVIRVAAVGKLDTSDLTFIIKLFQFYMNRHSSTGKQHNSDPITICVLGLQSQRLALYYLPYLMTRFSSQKPQEILMMLLGSASSIASWILRNGPVALSMCFLIIPTMQRCGKFSAGRSCMNLETKFFKFPYIQYFPQPAHSCDYVSLLQCHVLLCFAQQQCLMVDDDLYSFIIEQIQRMDSAVELDNFEDGRPMYMKTTQETAQKIKILKTKKQYKELLDLAASMPNTKEKYMLQANACLHLKKWKELSETCDRGLDLTEEKESSDLLNLKGKAVGKLGNFEEKVKLTQRAVDIDSSVAAYHRNLGAAYYKLKNYERALQCHTKAIELQPKHSINYHNKGAAYFRLQQYQNALGCFEKATELDKKQVISYGWLADTYKQMGDHQRAKDYYLRAYEISGQEQYKSSAREMDEKLNPGKKKGFFSRIFG